MGILGHLSYTVLVGSIEATAQERYIRVNRVRMRVAVRPIVKLQGQRDLRVEVIFHGSLRRGSTRRSGFKLLIRELLLLRGLGKYGPCLVREEMGVTQKFVEPGYLLG